MVVITRHKSADFGTKLELDHKGVIKKKIICARDIGTTVSLSNLFSTLPVRKREFQKNIKKEFNKLCQILQGYCLVAKGVRIICTNQNQKGSKMTVMSTEGSQSILDNISSIFGPRQTTDLLELQPAIRGGDKFTKSVLIDSSDPNKSLDIDEGDLDNLNLSRFQIEGWISNCGHGFGRSSKDRQFIFVNSRPCEPKQITKLINEVYHRYNVSQYPFIFMNLVIERSDVDVNLTPDKRQVLVNNEKILLLALKKSLFNTFGDIPSTFKHQNTKFRVTNKKEESDDEISPEKLKPNQGKFTQMLSQWKMTGKTDELLDKPAGNKRKICDEISTRNTKMKKIQEYLTQEVIPFTPMSYKSEEEEDEVTEIEQPVIEILTPPETDSEKMEVVEDKEEVHVISCKVSTKIPEIEPIELEEEVFTITCKNDDKNHEKLDFEIIENPPDESSSIKTSIDQISNLIKLESKNKLESTERKKLIRLKFKANLDPTSNKKAEEELETEITKEKFQTMEIIGQFNSGFIITKLEDDLFIIDQHASDEKYNFETLQKKSILENQKLVTPQNLELTAVNEMILLDNIEIFRMNGFEFLINESAEPTKKVRLSAKPYNKNWEFGKEDIDELLFMLQDNPNSVCRPSRVRDMFASKACRSSVMIGTALLKPEMSKLVEQMGEIEHPWVSGFF